MHKETSSRVSTIAAHYLKQSDREIEILIETNQANVIKDIRTLAASALGQDEHQGQRVRGTFLDRLKDEHRELSQRIEALQSFLTHNPGHASPKQEELLGSQLSAMKAYQHLLQMRLDDLELIILDPAQEKLRLASENTDDEDVAVIETGGHDIDRDGPVPFGG